MKSLSFALTTFFALFVSVVVVQAQTGPANPACQKICPKVCDKSKATTSVALVDTNTAEKPTAKEEEGKVVKVSLVETKTATGSDLASPVVAKKKVNCDPANCDPANCDPANCPPSKCKQKAESSKAL